VLQDLNYLGSALLVLAVFRQIRPAPMTIRNVVWPLVVVAAILLGFMSDITFSSQGNSILLIVLSTAIGVTLGGVCGATTRIFRDEGGRPMAQAGVVAAVMWLVGMMGRLAFVLYADHGGTHTIAQWTASLHISPSAWVPMLLFMALGEVLARTIVLMMKMQWPSGSGGRVSRVNI
jgi:hypothetical protein